MLLALTIAASMHLAQGDAAAPDSARIVRSEHTAVAASASGEGEPAPELTVQGGAPIRYAPFDWPDETPPDCPFPRSETFNGLRLLGRASDYRVADTFYPSWAADDKLYTPYTDGAVGSDLSISDGSSEHYPKADARTGQAVMEGDDPLHLTITSLGLVKGHPGAYGGRYPGGSLVHNGVWYYATYCLGPAGQTPHDDGMIYNWPVLGPVPGFRISHDYGKSWIPSPHSPDDPLFPEPSEHLGPVKIGAPHFVDFGRDMEHSPDGKAYLVAHGATRTAPPARYAHNSWISGDQVYLLRVTPSPETINDPAAWEFFAGRNAYGAPVWTRDFGEIRPLLEWEDNMGCVTVSYNAPLKKYLMCVTAGWPTCYKMSSYILEADDITGPWRLVTYLKDFGEQAYFLNFPTKFIGDDGERLWLCYSGNFAPDWNGKTIRVNPPGARYGLVLEEVQLLRTEARKTSGR